MKPLLNIRLLILSLTILGSGYLFYTAAHCSGQAEQDVPRPVMPSVISPFAQPQLVGLVSAQEVDEEKAYGALFSLRDLSVINASLY